MTVTWDARGTTGRHVVKIKMLNTGYQGNLLGICGNYNNNETDDHHPANTNVVGTDTEVGNSWIISESMANARWRFISSQQSVLCQFRPPILLTTLKLVFLVLQNKCEKYAIFSETESVIILHIMIK